MRKAWYIFSKSSDITTKPRIPFFNWTSESLITASNLLNLNYGVVIYVKYFKRKRNDFTDGLLPFNFLLDKDCEWRRSAPLVRKEQILATLVQVQLFRKFALDLFCQLVCNFVTRRGGGTTRLLWLGGEKCVEKCGWFLTLVSSKKLVVAYHGVNIKQLEKAIIINKPEKWWWHCYASQIFLVRP